MPRSTTGYIEVTVRFSKEDDQWTAVCLELGTAACGDSLDSAHEAINDLITLHLNSLEQIGMCGAFLKEHGIAFHTGTPGSERRPVRVRPGEFVTTHTERLPLAMAK